MLYFYGMITLMNSLDKAPALIFENTISVWPTYVEFIQSIFCSNSHACKISRIFYVFVSYDNSILDLTRLKALLERVPPHLLHWQLR